MALERVVPGNGVVQHLDHRLVRFRSANDPSFYRIVRSSSLLGLFELVFVENLSRAQIFCEHVMFGSDRFVCSFVE